MENNKKEVEDISQENKTEKHQYEEKTSSEKIEHETKDDKSADLDKESKPSTKISYNNPKIIKDINRLLKSWFSERPISAFSSKISKQTTMLLFLFSSITAFFAIVSSLNIGINSMLPFSINMVSLLTFPTIVFVVSFYLLLSSGVMVIAKISKSPKSDYMSSLELVMISSLPANLILILGMILEAIYNPIGVVAKIVAVIIFSVALYLGNQKYLGFPKKSPFWTYAIILFIFLLLMLFIILILFKVVLDGGIGHMRNFGR